MTARILRERDEAKRRPVWIHVARVGSLGASVLE